MVQKILSGQTFTNISSLRCDLDLQRSNPIFPHDTLAYDAVLSNKVWLQIDQQFRRYSKNNHILIIQALTVTSILKIVNQSFRMTHCLMIIHHLTKFGKKWLSGSGDIKRNRSDTQTELQMDKRMDGQSDSNIKKNNPIYMGGGGITSTSIL